MNIKHINEELLRQQQKKIEELERELKKSQLALKQQQLVVLKQQQAGVQGNINPQVQVYFYSRFSCTCIMIGHYSKIICFVYKSVLLKV